MMTNSDDLMLFVKEGSQYIPPPSSVLWDMEHLFEPGSIPDKDWEGTPIKNGKESKSGAYAFATVDVFGNYRWLYVGKAKLLLNRVQQHWSSTRPSAWIDSYWDAVFSEDSDIEGVPVAFFWITDKGAALESDMIKAFRPLYNKRND